MARLTLREICSLQWFWNEWPCVCGLRSNFGAQLERAENKIGRIVTRHHYQLSHRQLAAASVARRIEHRLRSMASEHRATLWSAYGASPCSRTLASVADENLCNVIFGLPEVRAAYRAARDKRSARGRDYARWVESSAVAKAALTDSGRLWVERASGALSASVGAWRSAA